MKKIFILSAISCQLLAISPIEAQLNRAALNSNITSNLYQNSTHSITGAILQGVMLNQNNSYAVILSDTLLFDIRNFSPSLLYTPGMGCFYADTLFKDSVTHTGTWKRSDFIKINNGSSAATINLLSKQTLNLNTTADQTVTLSGGTAFVITDILFTNASATPLHALNGELWSGTSRTGHEFAITTDSAFFSLTSSSVYFNTVKYYTSAAVVSLQPNPLPETCSSPLYFSVGTAEGTAKTCEMYIYGYILN